MAAQPDAPATLPEHFKDEWTKARDVIEKLDDRIQDTRRLVFGLFSTLLGASSIFGKSFVPSGFGWLGLHLSLLGWLTAGRFIEQQAHRLQDIVAARACVLELLTPVELTDTVSERWETGGGSRRTTYVYVALGVVSTAVSSVAAGAGLVQVLATVGITAVYVVLVILLGRQDVVYAREGQDWSFDRTRCSAGESVSLLLVNLGDRHLYPASPAAELIRVLDENGGAVAGPRHPLEVPEALLGPGRSLPPRRACHWIWRPPEPGLWVLRGGSVIARRAITVQAAPVLPPADVVC